MGESRESVQQAFAKFVGWRSHIIKAVIDDGKLYRKTIVEDKPYRKNIFGQEERCVFQVELDDELVHLLPSSTMPLNFTTRKISDWNWIYRLCTYFDAWLVSIALKCVGHDDRKLLVKEIKKRASIGHVILSLGSVKTRGQSHRPVDGDGDCYVCEKSAASSVYWYWCGTCKDDEVWQYCNFCESEHHQCQSCCSDFAEVVRCSDKFLPEWS